MQYSTFAAIDIGSYDVILEIFEISKKQGIRRGGVPRTTISGLDDGFKMQTEFLHSFFDR